MFVPNGKPCIGIHTLHSDYPEIEAQFKAVTATQIDRDPTAQSIAEALAPTEQDRATLIALAHKASRSDKAALGELTTLISAHALRPSNELFFRNGAYTFTFSLGDWITQRGGDLHAIEKGVGAAVANISRWNKRFFQRLPKEEQPKSLAEFVARGMVESVRHHESLQATPPDTVEATIRAMDNGPPLTGTLPYLYGAALKTAYLVSSQKMANARMMLPAEPDSHGFHEQLHALEQANQQTINLQRSGKTILAPPHSLPFVEAHHDSIVETLKKAAPAKEGGTHVGVAGFFNLDLIAARRSKAAVLCDINPMQEALWELVAISLHWSENRQDFVHNIKDFLPAFGQPHSRFSPDASGQYDRTIIQNRLDAELSRPASWLSSDASFAHVKSLFAEHKVGFLRLDLTDPKKTAELRNALHAKHLHIDSFYPSNVVHFLLGAKNYYDQSNSRAMDGFITSVDTLCGNTTHVIDASRAVDLPMQPKNTVGGWSKAVSADPTFETFLRTKPEFLHKLGEWKRDAAKSAAAKS